MIYIGQCINRSQNDPQWKDDYLGSPKSGLKIGSFGCFCTALAMRYGITSKEMNIKLSGKGISKYSGLLDANLAARTLGYKYTKEDYSTKIAPLDGIINRLKNGKVVVLEVDQDHKESTSPKHFVVAKKWDGKTLTIVDSWDGKEYDISKKYYMVVNGVIYNKPGNCIISIRYFD